MSGGITATTVLAGAAVAGTALSAYSLLTQQKGSNAPAAPAAAKSTVMPTPDDDAVKKAARATQTALQTRSGRQSTILSGESDELLGG